MLSLLPSIALLALAPSLPETQEEPRITAVHAAILRVEPSRDATVGGAARGEGGAADPVGLGGRRRGGSGHRGTVVRPVLRALSARGSVREVAARMEWLMGMAAKWACHCQPWPAPQLLRDRLRETRAMLEPLEDAVARPILDHLAEIEGKCRLNQEPQ